MLYHIGQDFAANQQKWVRSISAGEVEISSNTLEALNRRRLYLLHHLERIGKSFTAELSRTGEYPHAWTALASKVQRASERLPELAESLAETNETIDFVESFLSEYPAS